MKFRDFQAPVLFSSTFKALNLREKNSSTFKDAWEPWLLRWQDLQLGRRPCFFDMPPRCRWKTSINVMASVVIGNRWTLRLVVLECANFSLHAGMARLSWPVYMV